MSVYRLGEPNSHFPLFTLCHRDSNYKWVISGFHWGASTEDVDNRLTLITWVYTPYFVSYL